MPSQASKPLAQKRRGNFAGELWLRSVRSFDRRQSETRQYAASIVQFRSNRFRLSDAETERMLRLSMEAIQDEW